MAVCKRCGKVFDYNKRDGVCPKCCFYNRPEGTWQEDSSWTKNYNYEDNSYDITAHEYDTHEGRDTIFGRDENDVGGRLKDVFGHHGSKEMTGSHKHTSDGRILTGRSATTKKGAKKKAKSSGSGKGIGSTILVAIVWILIILFGFLMD